MAELNDGTYEMIGCAMEVHRQLGPGLREKPYENGLVIALSKAGFRTEQQKGWVFAVWCGKRAKKPLEAT